MARKQRKCKQCKRWFTPFNTLQKTCPTPACAIAEGKRLREQERRKDTRERKRALKTRSDVLKEAQAAFNAYIRTRDREQPCICCGRLGADNDLITGSRWDAGHYRSVGAAPHLRFNEDNCHRQLVYCNRYRSSNSIEYRKGLIERIGEDRVLALEQDNSIKRWTKDELIEIRDYYKAKTKEL